ncbi:acetylcholine receptor subunit alpha-like 1 isoform X2 [Chelonus insularis]|uniref:acetylcholine receptor subunit alpha-like 1 isoform X2 n=1 Tax=Chelonus insularis TaxID=460826 RepID=UPI00158EF015|nr:acetylcholine receptor subunit alpha-like 1 isoform X2 [Chelonus insularis]
MFHTIFYFYGVFIGYIFYIILTGSYIHCVDAGYSGLWNATWTDKLKRDLLFKYDKFARPAQHYNTTRVYFGMTIFHISMDEFKSAIGVQAWVRMLWMDEKLKWNSSDYGGLRRLQVGNHEVWQPDIILYNSVAVSSIEHYGDTHCHIYEDGTVLWVPPTQFLALCDLDLRLWPFDTQTCSLKLGSWTYPGNQIDLRLSNSSLEGAVHLIQNTEWKLVEITRLRNITTYECCPDEPYIHLVFTLTIRRNSPLYSSVFITPTAVIVIMSLVNFWLPPKSKEKLIMCGCNALITSIFLIYFSNKIPPHSSNAPLIVSFYSGCLYQIIISLVISVLVINLSQRPYCKPLPRNIKNILVSWTGKYLGLSDLIHAIQASYPADNGDRENIISPTTSVAQLEWILLATAIDRIFFIIFCNNFGLMAITCLS